MTSQGRELACCRQFYILCDVFNVQSESESSSIMIPRTFFALIRAYRRKWGHACSIAKKVKKKAQRWIFTPHFSKFRAFRTLHPPKWNVVLEFLVENKAFHFSKRALPVATTHNKWLKKAMLTFVKEILSMVIGMGGWWWQFFLVKVV